MLKIINCCSNMQKVLSNDFFALIIPICMKVRDIAFIAIATALMCILAPISVPIGIVPITLGTLALYLIGAILGPVKATIAIILYILLGLAGLPVFSGFKSGAAVLTGPTGGFIVGYIPAVFAQSLFTSKFSTRKSAYVFGILFGTVIIYGFGVAWFLLMVKGKYTFEQAMAACVYPFLIGDSVKLILAVSIGYKLRPLFERITDTSKYRKVGR